MEQIPRQITEKIVAEFFLGKVIVLYGPRRAGKTTLIKQIQSRFLSDSVYLSCDEPDVRIAFTGATSSAMKAFIGDKKLVFLDEAQRVKDIGLSLKLLVDTYPKVQVVATGSSSFELANSVSEPLTGRKKEFFLPPISIAEMKQSWGELEIHRTLEQRLIFGMYPDVLASGTAQAGEVLSEIGNSYLYQDVLAHQRILHPDMLEKILRALALQIGQEVSYNEVATTVGITKQTVERYIELLEKTFVIFRLPPLCRNRRQEIGKLRKIYFLDNGIRNLLLGSLQDMTRRDDVGRLWENFLMSERYKFIHATGQRPNRFFWRTYQQQELDYVEEMSGILSGYEFKWRDAVYRPPKAFGDLYPDVEVSLVNRENFLDFVS